jgi:hypothetical protein
MKWQKCLRGFTSENQSVYKEAYGGGMMDKANLLIDCDSNEIVLQNAVSSYEDHGMIAKRKESLRAEMIGLILASQGAKLLPLTLGELQDKVLEQLKTEQYSR